MLKLPDFLQNVATSSATNLYFSPDSKKLLYQATASFTLPDNLLPPLPSSSTQVEARTTQVGSWYVYDLKEDKNFLISEGVLPSPQPSNPAGVAKRLNSRAPTPTPDPFVPSKLTLVDNLQDPLPAELISSPSAFHKLQTNYTSTQSITLLNAQYSPIFVTSVQWYPDSSHLILTTDNSIDIMEYDGTNRVTVYGGPMDKSIVYPWPDGSKVITRIQFSPDTIPNLYTIKLK